MKRIHTHLLAIGVAVALLPQSLLASIYTFDNLNTGQLAGQDNWMILNGNQTSYLIANGTGFDTTRVARNPGSTLSFQDIHLNGRQNNGNYSFGNLSGATALTMSFDTQVQNNAGEDQFINFSLSNSTITNYSSPGFSYHQSFGGTPTWGLGGASYTGGPAAGGTSGNLPGGISTNDWIRLQLVMNTTANGGVGTGNLFFTDLTQAGTPQLLTSNFNLNLNPVGNLGVWDTMWSRSDFASSVVIDNLTVTAVPEVSNLWFTAFVAAVSFGHLASRRRPARVAARM